MWHSYSWPQVTPFSGGVAIVSPDFSLSAIWKPNSSEQHHENKRVQGKLGCYTQTLFLCYTPPFVSVAQNKRSFVARKNPQFNLHVRPFSRCISLYII